MDEQMIYHIKEVRRKKNMSLRQLEKISGVSNSYISQIENNKKHPTVLVLCQLADALEVPTEDLYTYSRTIASTKA